MPEERHSRFDVVLYRVGDSSRQRLVIEAAGPLGAAIEAFSRCVDDGIEVVDGAPPPTRRRTTEPPW